MEEKGLILKAAAVLHQDIDEVALALINNLALKVLTAEEVFIFKISMCDNEVDRTYEVFPLSTLNELAKLYEGKTVLFDHQRTTKGQCARIYKTEVVTESTQSSTGEPYSKLVAHCYMLKNATNEPLIADIEGGIKKEVSVGCRIGSAICSICGTDNTKTWCDHNPGGIYDGEQCHFKLERAKDAYEVSFVAVPAQPKAGVCKTYGAEQPSLKEENGTENIDLEMQLALAAAFLNTQKNSMEE